MRQLKRLAEDKNIPVATLVRLACRDWLERHVSSQSPEVFQLGLTPASDCRRTNK